MGRWRDKPAIVTNIGSNVGSEIAYQLINKAMYVSVFATPDDDITGLYYKLDQLKRRNYLYTVERDANSDDDIQALFSTIQSYSRYYSPVVLVNNVSFATESFSTLTDSDTIRWQQLKDTKIQRMTTYARETIDLMKAQKVDGGYIFNIIKYKFELFL